VIVSNKSHQGEQEGWRSGWDGEKDEWKLCEANTRAGYRGQNELIGTFKMAVGDELSIGGASYEVGIKSELVRFDVDCDWKD
jgi:hypothetical protein